MAIPALTITKQYQDGEFLTEAQLDAAFESANSWSNVVANRAPDKTGADTVTGPWTFAASGIKLSGAGSGIATLTNANTSSNRTLTLPDATGTFVLEDNTATVSSKTLASPVISGTPTASGALGISSSKLTVGDGTTANVLLRTDGLATDTDSTQRNLTTSVGGFSDVDGTNLALTFNNTIANSKIRVIFDFTIKIREDAGGNNFYGLRLSDGSDDSVEKLVGVSGVTVTFFPVTLVHDFTYTSTGNKTVTLEAACRAAGSSPTTPAINPTVGAGQAVCYMSAFRVSD